MKLNYAFYIPSRERARWLMEQNYSTLKEVYHLKPKLYVRDNDSQMKDYEKYAKIYNVNICIQDSSKALGASETYDSLIDRSIKEGYKYLIMFDDDLHFKMRNPIFGGLPAFPNVPKEEMKLLLDHALDILCPEIPMITIPRILQRTQPYLLKFCAPTMNTYFCYLPHFKKYPEYRFNKGWEVEARCDINLTLQLLTNGFLTAFLMSLLIVNNKINNPGGCSTYRTMKFEKASVQYLKSHYPNLIRIKEKKGWPNFGTGIWDPNIIMQLTIGSWKKSFNREKFQERFNISANDFVINKINEYEKVYSDFVSNIRSRKC